MNTPDLGTRVDNENVEPVEADPMTPDDERLPYTPPTLIDRGDVADVTATGGNPGGAAAYS